MRFVAIMIVLAFAGCVQWEDADNHAQTESALTAFTIYDNTVQNGFWGGAWAAASEDSCSTTHYSSPTCAYMVELQAWGGLQFGRSSGFSTSGYSHVELTLYPNDHWLGGFRVALTRHPDAVDLGVVTLTDSMVVQSYPNGFKRVRVPISSLNAGGATALALELRNQTEWQLRPIWVDEVRLVDENETPPPPSGNCAFGETFEAFSAGTWGDGTFGAWTTVYTTTIGIQTDGTKVLYEQPPASTSPGETHANLVVSNYELDGNVDFTLRIKTVQQLRTGSAPNAWEVAWVFWNYLRPEQSYYFIPKPNGWELGKSDDTKLDPNGPECDWPTYTNCLYAGAQRYLATGSSPTFPVGPWYTVRVTQSGGAISVWVDGTLITSVTDTVNVLTNGKLGLYTEDAHARFDDICIGGSGGTVPNARLSISTAAHTVAEEQCSGLVKLHRRDLAGNLAPTPAYMDIQLTGTGFTFFSDSSCANAITQSFLGAGTHTNDIWFKNSQPGSQTLTISAPNHESASQVETITEASPDVQLSFGTAAQSVTAGQCSSVVKLERRNMAGALTPTSTFMTIQLAGDGFTFYNDAGCTNAVTSSFLGAGTHTNDIWFRHWTAGSRPITISATDHQSASQTETITAPGGGGGGGATPAVGPGATINFTEVPDQYEPAPPQAPNTTAQVTISGSTTLSTPQRHAIVSANLSSSDITIAASDIRVEVQPGARIRRITINPGVSRIRIHGGTTGSTIGGTVRDVVMAHPSPGGQFATDIDIDHIKFESPTDGAWGGTSLDLRGQKIRVTHCVADAARYSVWADDNNSSGARHGAGGSDILIAGNDFLSRHPTLTSGESTVRIVGYQRSAVLNNRLENNYKHTYRIHGIARDYYATHNVLVGGGIMLGRMPGDDLDYGIFRNNVLHHSATSQADFNPSVMFTFTLTSNQVRADGHSCYWQPSCSVPSHWTISGNVLSASACAPPRVAGAAAGGHCTL